MLSKEESAVMDHCLKEGLSKTATARKLAISRRTVQSYLKNSGLEWVCVYIIDYYCMCPTPLPYA